MAFADKIGGSALPSSTPSLRGRLIEDSGATSVAVLSIGGGATTNAGPTFAEVPSAFLERAIGYAKVIETSAGRVDLALNLSDRRYWDFTDADERSGNVGASVFRDWGGQQTMIAFAASTGRDIEEELTEASLSFEHAWTGGRAKPYIKADTALLDFSDLPDSELLQPFRNQDDRDRVSSRAQVGLRMTLTDHVEIEVGGGVDWKRYLQERDDFGVRRDSVSLFPLAGLSMTAGNASFRAVYMPFRRFYAEDLFRDTWVHGYAFEGEYKISDQIKAFAAARRGFEETDFLIASASHESVVLGGLVLTLSRGTLTFSASETRRAYDGLALLDVGRDDHKIEVAIGGEMPINDTLSLNGSINYMDYKSSFGGVRTDALTASLGLTYAVTD